MPKSEIEQNGDLTSKGHTTHQTAYLKALFFVLLRMYHTACIFEGSILFQRFSHNTETIKNRRRDCTALVASPILFDKEFTNL